MSRVKIIVIHSDSFPDLFSFYTQIADPRLLSEEILRIYGDLTSQHPGGDRMRSFPWGRMVSIRSLAFQASCFSGGGALKCSKSTLRHGPHCFLLHHVFFFRNFCAAFSQGSPGSPMDDTVALLWVSHGLHPLDDPDVLPHGCFFLSPSALTVEMFLFQDWAFLS